MNDEIINCRCTIRDFATPVIEEIIRRMPSELPRAKRALNGDFEVVLRIERTESPSVLLAMPPALASGAGRIYPDESEAIGALRWMLLQFDKWEGHK